MCELYFQIIKITYYDMPNYQKLSWNLTAFFSLLFVSGTTVYSVVSRAWVSAGLLSGVQSGALFPASAPRAPLIFSKKSARWAPFAWVCERNMHSFLALFLFHLCLKSFLKIQIFLSFFIVSWTFKCILNTCYCSYILEEAFEIL